MADLHELVIVCDKNRGDGTVTPVSGIEFPKGTCPCHGCTADYYLKRVGRVATAFGVYKDLLNLVSATDDFQTMSTLEIKRPSLTSLFLYCQPGRCTRISPMSFRRL